ncbi:OB-fold domain-containing protein [Leptospira sp. 96542]|nr:OB-fold domain-containing protein [Leptospira sp. 96542]
MNTSTITLLGTECSDCGFKTIEETKLCPSCGCDVLKEITVSPRGKIYSFTIVHVGFGHMADRAPYVLSIIETEDKIKLTTVLEDVNDFDSIQIGTLVEFKRMDEVIGPVFRV